MKKWLSLFLSLCSVVQAESFVNGRLLGQFGNQLFIVAAATSLALDNDATAIFPDFLTDYDPEFRLSFNYEKIFSHLNVSQQWTETKYIYNEKRFTFDPIPFHENMEIRGYFQSEKYFTHHKEQIIELFAPKVEILDYLREKYSDIIDAPNTVAIHYRSYEKEDPTHKVYTDCNLSYIAKAVELFPEDSLFVVFSNRIEWCKANLQDIAKNIRFIEGESHFHDFYLMSMCKHNIICNSSFSWWAAYLNRNPDKIVIAPTPWFSPAYKHDTRDLIPEGWLEISVEEKKELD